MVSKTEKNNSGISSVEFALLVPISFGLFLSFIQLIIYLLSLISVEYAAFSAARSFRVYGDRTLGEIRTVNLRSEPYTNGNQVIAEAAAEKILFESLLWENKKIQAGNPDSPFGRTYSDGNQHFYQGSNVQSSSGNVYVEFIGCQKGANCASGTGVKVHYCLPIIFPSIDKVFSGVKESWPCTGKALGREFSGIAISKRIDLGRTRQER